ncbi:hypothetical protein [Alkalicoccus urumqiensis]|nr:hypothetical protein [Alkalicoccus urumqiensis]
MAGELLLTCREVQIHVPAGFEPKLLEEVVEVVKDDTDIQW